MLLALLFLLAIANAAPPQVDGDLIVKLFAIASFIGNAVLIGMRIFGKGEKHEITPSPLVIAPHPRYASAEAFSNHATRDHQEHRRIEDKVDHSHRTLSEAGEKRGELINGKLDEMLKEMGDLKGTVGELKGKVAELTRRPNRAS